MRENMAMHKVRVYNPDGEGPIGTRCVIDGAEVGGIRSIDFRVSVDEVPHFEIETIGVPDIEMDADVRFHFTPKTVEQAARVICDTFCPGTEYYKAMAESIKDVIRNAMPECGEEFATALSEGITQRVCGQEMEITTPTESPK